MKSRLQRIVDDGMVTPVIGYDIHGVHDVFIQHATIVGEDSGTMPQQLLRHVRRAMGTLLDQITHGGQLADIVSRIGRLLEASRSRLRHPPATNQSDANFRVHQISLRLVRATTDGGLMG